MKYCITILLVLIFIIIFHNLLNYNTIETFHTGSEELTQTQLQRNINTAITNIRSAITQYQQENIFRLTNELTDYGSTFNQLQNEWENGSNPIATGSSCKYDQKISLDKFTKYEGLTCDFERPCSDAKTNYKEYSTINGNPKSLQECADMCENAGSNCIAFSYKDELNNQVCRLSSICTDKNANKNDEYTLYVDENIDYSNFPLSNYKIDYNKSCRKDVYGDNQNYDLDPTINKSDCAKQCNRDANCIAFEYTPNEGCTKQSHCYTNGCLENSGSDADYCTNTSLYTKKQLIPDNTKIPDYINCDVCENNKTVYNTDFFRLYSNSKIGRADLVFTNNVSKLQSKRGNNILEDILYYRVSNGNQIKLFENDNYIGTHIWLYPTFERKAINTIGDKELSLGEITKEQQIELQKLKSFKIYSDAKANEDKKQCTGYWEECDYNSNGNLEKKWIVLKDKEGSKSLPCPYKTETCNKDVKQKEIWDISNCVNRDDIVVGSNISNQFIDMLGTKIIAGPNVNPPGNVYNLGYKSGKGNESKDVNTINFPNEECTDQDYKDNDICDYRAEWSQTCIDGYRTTSGNYTLQTTSLGNCPDTRSCIWEAYGTYEGNYNNDIYQIEIGERPKDNGEEDRTREIFNYITMSKNGLNAETRVLSNDIIPRYEDRDIIIFGSRLRNEVAKSYIINKIYDSNKSTTQNNNPNEITIEIPDDGIKFKLYKKRNN